MARSVWVWACSENASAASALQGAEQSNAVFPNSDKCQFPTHRYLSVQICVQAGAEAWVLGTLG